MSTEQTTQSTRPLDTGELREISRQGWSVVRGLIDPARAEHLASRGRFLLGLDPQGELVRPGFAARGESELHLRRPSLDEIAFHEVAHDPILAASVAAALTRACSMVLIDDELSATRAQPASPRRYYQGSASRQLDTTFALTLVALEEITAAQGAPVFVGGSHRLGLTGVGFTSESQIAGWQRVVPGAVSEPQELAAGDAIVVLSETMRAFPANQTDRSALLYAVAHAPVTTTYVGFPVRRGDGSEVASHTTVTEAGFPVVHLGTESGNWRRRLTTEKAPEDEA